MLEEQPELLVQVGGADITVSSHSLGSQPVVCGCIDIVVWIFICWDIRQFGHHNLAQVALAAREQAVEHRVVQVGVTQGEEQGERLGHVGKDVDEINKTAGLLAFILEKLTRTWE